jgi:hypothetical protein
VEVLNPERHSGSILTIIKADKGKLLELESGELISFEITEKYLEKIEQDRIRFFSLSNFQRINSNKKLDRNSGTEVANDEPTMDDMHKTHP